MLFLRFALLISCLLLPLAVQAESLPPMDYPGAYLWQGEQCSSTESSGGLPPLCYPLAEENDSSPEPYYPPANGLDQLPPTDSENLQPYPAPVTSPAVPYAGGVNMSAAPVSADYFQLQQNKIVRWNDQTRNIMVYIADGSHLPGWRPENVQRVKAAFWEWEQAMAPRFHFIFMPDARGSDVEVRWAVRLSSSQTSSGDASGLNKYQTWGKFISKNDIELALFNPGEEQYPPNVIQSVALHEIGHMLGLKVHSDHTGDIMYSGQSGNAWDEVQHLSQRDINTLKRIYISKPDYTNPEGYHLSDFKSFQKTQRGHRLTLLWLPVPGVPFPVPVPLPF